MNADPSTIAPSDWGAEVLRIFATHGRRPFLVDAMSGVRLSYDQTLSRALRVAACLSESGLSPGDHVAVILPNSVEFVLLYFACLLGGFTAVPLNGAVAPKHQALTLTRSGVKAIVANDNDATNEACIAAASSLRIPVHRVATLFPGSGDDTSPTLPTVDATRLLSVHFTSGTTSLPKGVAHYSSSLLANALAFNRFVGISCDSRFLHVMPMGYMAGFLNTLLCPFVVGGSVVIGPQLTASTVSKFWEPVVEHGADTLWLSPTMLTMLNQLDRGAIGAAHCARHQVRVFSATAPLPGQVRDRFEQKYGVSVVESYGLSELLLLTANVGPSGSKRGSVGRLLPSAHIDISAGDGASAAEGCDGTIFVRTAHAMAGYLTFDTGEGLASGDEAFDTGDVGHMDADGYLFITGRRKDLIVRGGFNVSPRAIEEAVRLHEGIDDVAVVGAPHDFYGEQVIAVVVVRDGYSTSDLEHQCRAICARELGLPALPDRVVVLDRLPVGSTGKVQKHVLREKLAAVWPRS